MTYPEVKIAAKLESTYQHKNMMENSYSKVTREEQTSTIEASSKNRLFVPWMFSTAGAIYRKKKTGCSIKLIAISEWADQIIDQVYEYHLSIWLHDIHNRNFTRTSVSSDHTLSLFMKEECA